MRTLLLPFLLITFLFNACSNSDAVTEVAATNPCASVRDLTAIQQAGDMTFTITSDSSPLYYEVSYLMAGSDNNPESGQKEQMTTLTKTKSLNDLGLNPGNVYLFYARAVCSDNSMSEWTAPKSVTITEFCPEPYDLRAGLSNYGFEFDWSATSSASRYEVQYGTQGFSLGTGATIVSNAAYYGGMQMSANTTYDFYVRAFCNTTNTWSSWVGPYSYFSATNQNLCSVPTNLTYATNPFNATQLAVNFGWHYNGEVNFEFKVVRGGNIVATSTIDTSGTPVVILQKNATYQFFVRAICSSGQPTAWSVPLSFSI